MENSGQILAVMVAYLALLIAWGLYQGRKVKTESDYSIAGRNLPGWVAALSERATGESSWALLGLPGAAYAIGLLETWTAVGCVAGIVTAWAAIAWRLRDEAATYRANTFSEYIARRHGDMEKWIRVAGSFTIVFFFFFYVGAQFLGGGKTLFSIFGIDPRLGMFITAAIIVPYTIYGGFRSVVYTDVVQAIIMIVALIVGPIAGVVYVMKTPGLYASSIPEALRAAGPATSSLIGALSGFAAGTGIAGGLSWFFGYLGGQPQLSMRFMAIKDPAEARRGRNVGIAWTLLAYVGALAIGWIGIAIFGPNVLEDRELVMPMVMFKVFPDIIAAVLVMGAIAAMISTADSLLILSSTELSENLIGQLRGNAGTGSVLARSRMTTASLAAIALALAYLFPSKVIYTIVGFVWAGIGGTFSVVILLTLFWKKYHGRAVLCTIIGGLLFTIVWQASGMERLLTARIATFAFSALTAVGATMILPRANARG
jgi:sodium/proline symporter